MSWKINNWTGLFALAAMAALYFWYAGNIRSVPMTDLTEDRSCNAPDDIPESTAQTRIRAYQDGARHSRTTGEPLRVVNPYVHYFHLPRCELNKMLDSIPYGDVYAYMSIIPGLHAQDTLDLLFSDSLTVTFEPISPPEKLPIKYFDFTKPCPPICPDSSGSQ